MPYREHSHLETDEKLKRILRVTKQQKILLMQGKLKPDEEARLIEETMGQITKEFAGISFCTINPSNGNGKEQESFTTKLKNNIYNRTLGKRDFLTIIGPATLVREIRKNPTKIDLLLHQQTRRKK
jgi:hypothetical protein